MHTTIRTSPILMLAIIAALALPATTAQANQISAPITGFLDDGSSFDGTFRVDRFRSTRLGVIASGLVIGTVSSGGKVTDVISSRLFIPVVNMQNAGLNCDILRFSMDISDLDLTNFTVHLDEFEMELSKTDFETNIGSRFCTIADGFDDGRFTASVSALNSLLTLLARQ